MERAVDTPLLDVRAVRKYFTGGSAFFKPGSVVKAVDGVSFLVMRDSVFGLVGESGCGKSTVGRLILRLLTPTGGSVLFKGEDVGQLRGESLTRFRRSVQIVFQDPFASLNPRMRVIDTLSEPFKVHRLVPKREIEGRVVELLERVGLGSDSLKKYPHEFSGGQRQRICIARALTLSPELIVADEPLSALDVSIQAQILSLFLEIKRQFAISLVFISHDLNVVRYLSDKVGVMYLGRLVESGTTEEIFASPKHPYTELLLNSAPKIRFYEAAEPSRRVAGTASQGQDVPSLLSIPEGCPFHPRCPKKFEPCDKAVPEFKESAG
ncbi:MAG TPA: ABC transporter ATP-binding protein, partial [Dissulfurispiraceae bacterium]|nr:ABC transporter ATP-binding protein [Dissulfurispiraceae bacterium]